jgi:hypothetical protein
VRGDTGHAVSAGKTGQDGRIRAARRRAAQLAYTLPRRRSVFGGTTSSPSRSGQGLQGSHVAGPPLPAGQQAGSLGSRQANRRDP